MREEFARLLSAGNGFRNDILNTAAFNLAQIVAGGALEEAHVRAGLIAAALAIGLPEGEALSTIKSGFAAGLKSPRGPKEPRLLGDPSRNAEVDGKSAAPEENPGGGQGGRASRFYSAAELKQRPVPTREWLVDGLVPMKNVTLLSGDGGTGKSLVAHMLGISVAAGGRGRNWLGMPVNAGRVIYLSCEDDDEELHRRSADILRHYGLEYDDIAGMTLRSLAGEDALLAIETKIALIRDRAFRRARGARRRRKARPHHPRHACGRLPRQRERPREGPAVYRHSAGARNPAAVRGHVARASVAHRPQFGHGHIRLDRLEQ